MHAVPNLRCNSEQMQWHVTKLRVVFHSGSNIEASESEWPLPALVVHVQGSRLKSLHRRSRQGSGLVVALKGQNSDDDGVQVGRRHG